jgi:hypothetical protein
MGFLIDNWYVLLAFAALLIAGIFIIVRFFNQPSEKQIAALKEWLLYAVTMAEKDLGSGTGKLKLRQVYDLFLIRFPWMAKVISFEQFSFYVDEALEQMKEMLKSNTSVQSLVNGEGG